MVDAAATLDRRLERYRAATRGSAAPVTVRASPAAIELATRLATAIDGEVVRTSDGLVVRAEPVSRALPVDRVRLASLPGQPPTDVPLVCLDTETTGLATAAGTVAFLIGLGWWEEGDRFRQVQLILPEHAEERALLGALAAAIPRDAWLVTYNGRGFDWPLLVARYRLAGRAAPVHAGHLDLLPVVRRLFRHRMPNARLRTAEAALLGLHRHGDVDGGEIPERYFGFLRGGPAENLVAVVRHNDQDVRSLARLLAHLEAGLGDAAERARAPVGDLAGLARAFAREHRLGEALACLETASARADDLANAPPGGHVRDPWAAAGADPWATADADPWRAAERVVADRSPTGAERSAAGPQWVDTQRWAAADAWAADGSPAVADAWPRAGRPVDGRRGAAGGSVADAWLRAGRPVDGRRGAAGGSVAANARATADASATTSSSEPVRVEPDDDPWWSPTRHPDFGGRPRGPSAAAPIAPHRSAAFDAPWTAERIAADRAHVLRRLGRFAEAAEAWDALAAGPGRLAIVAAIELAKIHEHRLRDRSGALAATRRGLALVERRRRIGRADPTLEADLRRRLVRLRGPGGPGARRPIA